MIDLEDIISFLKKNYLLSKRLDNIIKSKLNIKRKLPTKDELKVVNFDSDYEITFSLIDSQPSSKTNWNIEFCFESNKIFQTQILKYNLKYLILLQNTFKK